MIPYFRKLVIVFVKKIWFSSWTNLGCSILLCSLDWTVGGSCHFFIVVHPDEGEGLEVELAEEKAQYHLWAVFITPVSAIIRSSAGQRWVLEAMEKFNRICFIVDLDGIQFWSYICYPQDFPKDLDLKISSSFLPLGFQNLPPMCLAWEGRGLLYSTPKEGNTVPFLPCQCGSSSLGWVILWKHKTYQR